MRKNIFLYSVLFFLLMFLGSNCIAGESQMQVKLWKDFSTVNLSGLNSYINSLSLLADGATVPSIDTIKTGEAWGMDIGYMVYPNLVIGPRIEYIIFNTGEINQGYTSTTFKTDLVAGLLGGCYKVKVTGRFSITNDLYLGYAMANLELKSKLYSGLFSKTSYKGSGFMANVSSGIEYKLASFFSVETKTGYRYARISKMKQKENNDTALATITNGDLLRNLLGNDIVCDYSGITISISANFEF